MLRWPFRAWQTTRYVISGFESHQNVHWGASNVAFPSCRDLSKLVTGHMERALRPMAEVRVLLQLLLCPACRGHFAQMRTMVRVLRGE